MKLVVSVNIILVLLITAMLSQHMILAASENGCGLERNKRYVLDEDFEDIASARFDWFPIISDVGNCSVNIEYINDTFEGDKLLKISTDVHKRTTYLQIAKFDFAKIPMHAKIGFTAVLNVLSTDNSGNSTGVIIGLSNKDFLDDTKPNNYFTQGFSKVGSFSLLLGNCGKNVTFQDKIVGAYVTNQWYTIEVVLDESARRWECYIPQARIEATGDIKGAYIFHDYFCPRFIIGIDGINQSILIDRVQLFYFLPTFQITIPPQVVAQVGETANISVCIITSENLDSDFALNVSTLPPNSSYIFEPNLIQKNLTSNLSIHTSSSTPPGTYTINVTATYTINETKEPVSRSNAVNLILIPPSSAPLWSQSWFWITVTACATALLASLLLIRTARKARIVAGKTQSAEKGEKEYLTCSNPACGFKEVPLHSEYCPACGKPIREDNT